MRSIILALVMVLSLNTIMAQVTYPYNFKYDGNPLARTTGAADPSVHVWDNTVWMYTSQDHGEGYAGMDGYHAWSSTDMVNWTDYGDVFNSSMLNRSAWGATQRAWMWAPGAARKQDAKGVWTYYLYYPHNKAAVGAGENWVTGVATAPDPWGPFTDHGIVKGTGNATMAMDPMVFIDDDGQAYIYANTLRVAKLNPDLVSLAEEPRSIGYVQNSLPSNWDDVSFGEGSYMHKKNGLYYFSWSNNGGHYATATNPYGPFTWGGTIATGPIGAQDHHSIVQFNEQWYYFYHIAIPEFPAIRDGQSRIACFDRLYYNKDGTIKRVVQTVGPTKILKTNVTNGSILLNPPGGAYADGTKVTLTAISDLGFAFNTWSGDLSGSENPTTIILNSDKSVSANYTVTPTCSLKIKASNGSVLLNPPGGVYNPGTVVSLTPEKDFGYAFNSWSGDLSGSKIPETITMNSNKNVTANFTSVPTYKIESKATNGIIVLNPLGGIYEKDTKVTISALQDFSYKFNGWGGDLSGMNNTATLLMNSDKKLAANFSLTDAGKIVFATNCGGEAFRSGEGIYYSADKNYIDGRTYSKMPLISGTEDDALFQSERNGSNFSYKIPLPNNEYQVTLMFAEIYHGSAGSRVFNVYIEGVKVSNNLDIYSKVGKNVAYDETHTVKVSDGELNISFETIKDNAKISAIKIVLPDGTDKTNQNK
jgi:arabinoxylan arabinofuranohydrolase